MSAPRARIPARSRLPKQPEPASLCNEKARQAPRLPGFFVSGAVGSVILPCNMRPPDSMLAGWKPDHRANRGWSSMAEKREMRPRGYYKAWQRSRARWMDNDVRQHVSKICYYLLRHRERLAGGALACSTSKGSDGRPARQASGFRTPLVAFRKRCRPASPSAASLVRHSLRDRPVREGNHQQRRLLQSITLCGREDEIAPQPLLPDWKSVIGRICKQLGPRRSRWDWGAARALIIGLLEAQAGIDPDSRLREPGSPAHRPPRAGSCLCEVVPFHGARDALERLKPKAIILSGGPASVTEGGSPPNLPPKCWPTCPSLGSAMVSRRW